VNIDHPFHFDSLGRTAGTSWEDHVRDMLEQLLFTDPGERVNRPDFGTGARALLFRPNSPELAAAVRFTLQASLGRWFSDALEVQDLSADADDASLRITIAYRLRNESVVRETTLSRPLEVQS
jgi:phage baseplate assembly protein W